MLESNLYSVKPVQELIDGRWCYVLEYPTHDRIWIDAERNFAILARELYDPATGSIHRRIDCSEYHEIASGIWAPRQFRLRQFDELIATSGEKSSQANGDITAHVRKVLVNEDVSDSLFEFHPLPGSLEIYEGLRFAQAVPGGSDYVEGIVTWIKRYVPVEVPRSSVSIEIIIEGIVIVLCLILFGRRLLPKSLSKSTATGG